MKRRNLEKQAFNFLTRAIYRTPEVCCDPYSGVTILSQCYHADLQMYLIAAKSLARYLRPKRFVVVDDGLTEEDRRTIWSHLCMVEFVKTSEVDVVGCPTGGTWERLLTIVDLVRNDYVVQLDSDTVTLSCPTEVLECIRANRSFTLGTMQGRAVTTVAEASAFARSVPGGHVQLVAERALERLPNGGGMRYVRGCSGFAGFARGSVALEQLQRFSRGMEMAIGSDVWHSWGSEQVASNYLIANSDSALVLPFEKYPYWSPEVNSSDARLVHFIGQNRFRGWGYSRAARSVIRSLR